MIEIVLLLIGLLAGFFAGYLFVAYRMKDETERRIANHPMLGQLREQAQQASTELKIAREEKEKKIAELAASLQLNNSFREKLEGQAMELEKVRAEFTKEFQLLANRIFEEKSEKFSQQNKDQLESILNPLKEKLRDFEQKVEKVYGDEKTERIRLKEELKLLAEMNKQLSSDANNLATALKGDNKTQGNWGEILLEQILQRSGLVEGDNYQTQVASVNAEGERIKPDVIVTLPDGKAIVIDSKVSLLAYTSYTSTESDEERHRFLKLHAESVRTHVKTLSEKNYHTATGTESPEVVLLFIPIEPALGAALQFDPELFSFAWDRKIVIVSPSTLFATLRTVASIWKQEKQTRNTMMIAEEGGKLYDKFVAFTEDLIAVGKKMDEAKRNYEDAMNKLAFGTGNLTRRAEKMRELGAKATKSLNSSLKERASESDQSEPEETNQPTRELFP